MTVTSFLFPASNIAIFKEKVDKANARLERNGIADRFTFVALPFSETTEISGITQNFFEVEMNTPEIVVGGWTFVASIVVEEGGVVIHCAPGQMLTGFDRPDTHKCDHCNINRARNRSYVLRHEDGRTMQVGSSCLELFLGVKVKGLWLLESFTAEQIAEMYDQAERGIGAGDFSYDVSTVVRYALIVSEMGKKFVSKGAAQDQNLVSTFEMVMAVFNPGRRSEDIKWAGEVHEAAMELSEDTITAVLDSVNSLSDSEYRDNLTAIVGSEAVSYRSLGLLVSIVAVWNREQGKIAERKANPIVSGFLGEPKQKLDGISAVVTFIRIIEGQWGDTTLISFRTEDGHSVKWFASNAPEVEVGDQVTIKGTVKDHETYNGIDSTLITRAKLAKV